MRYCGIRNFASGFILLVGPSLWAQSEVVHTDILFGRITDTRGRPVADAQVGITSVQSGLKRTFVTDEDGRYRVAFPENAAEYIIQVKRVGFPPVQRTIGRTSEHDEQIRTDIQFVGVPLALSNVQVGGDPNALMSEPPAPDVDEKPIKFDPDVPNPISEILRLRDTLHLSAVQIVALGYISDTLQLKNSTIYNDIKTLLVKSEEAGDPTQMAGTVAMMLEEASGNTGRAIDAAERVLRPEQWSIVPQRIRARPEATPVAAGVPKQ